LFDNNTKLKNDNQAFENKNELLTNENNEYKMLNSNLQNDCVFYQDKIKFA